MNGVTHDFATTSTNCPGTKWIADNVVPMRCSWRGRVKLKCYYIPTGTCASGVTGNSFTTRLGGTWAFWKWPRICLVVVFIGLSDAATCTAWYSVWFLRIVLIFAVTWQFSSCPTCSWHGTRHEKRTSSSPGELWRGIVHHGRPT